MKPIAKINDTAKFQSCRLIGWWNRTLRWLAVALRVVTNDSHKSEKWKVKSEKWKVKKERWKMKSER